MPSFDVVSEIDHHELTNAVDQTQREISNRFDFKGTKAAISLAEQNIKLEGDSDFHIQQIHEILYKKLAKRGIDLDSLDHGKLVSSNMKCEQIISVKEGIDKDTAKKIIKHIKESKMKVQAGIQGEQVRVTGKKRDDLQQAIALLKESNLGLPLQFKNFRD